MRYWLAGLWARLWRRPVLKALVECCCGRCYEIEQYQLFVCRCQANLWIDGKGPGAEVFAAVPETYPWGERGPVLLDLRYTEPGAR